MYLWSASARSAWDVACLCVAWYNVSNFFCQTKRTHLISSLNSLICLTFAVPTTMRFPKSGIFFLIHKIIQSEQGFIVSISVSFTIKLWSGIFCRPGMSSEGISGWLWFSSAIFWKSFRISNNLVIKDSFFGFHKIMQSEQGFLLSISGSSTMKWLSGMFCEVGLSWPVISGWIGSSRATSLESFRSSNDLVLKLS